tara:strand:+ start:3078 stop:3815 length:738 start_codon:yes stop_codon:yes gene_type:complete
MKKVKWVIFDLDDTLHEFSTASRTAMEMVYHYLHEEFGIYPDDAREAYAAILKEGQSTHFVEDIPSRVYRRQRFEKLFDRFSLIYHIHLDRCLDVYDDSLMEVMTLKEGALEILQECQKHKLNVMVVSEGPRDAQKKAIEKLGIASYVNRVFTSSQCRMHKANGLFTHALKEVGCSPDESIVIGDNPERDIKPAQALGLLAILVTTKAAPENMPFVASLKELADRLRTETQDNVFPMPLAANVLE